MKPKKRADRVGERLRAELSTLVLRGRLRDPRTRDLIVSRVSMSDDLQHARVYVRILGEADSRRQSGVVRALAHAEGFLRREVGPQLGLRRVPELHFFWDDEVDRVDRLERIFAEIRAEEAPKEDPA